MENIVTHAVSEVCRDDERWKAIKRYPYFSINVTYEDFKAAAVTSSIKIGRYKTVDREQSSIRKPSFTELSVEHAVLGYMERADVSCPVPSEDAENFAEIELIAALEDDSVDQMGHNVKLDIGNEMGSDEDFSFF